MSYVGKNIKKIRSVKNLNQTQFAEIFDLKRASIGAYEEGRAEPKIATLTEIAKKFGISVDELLNKELSVNDLFHFDIFKKDYVKSSGNQLRPSKMPQSFCPVYYISSERRKDYFEGAELSEFTKISLPIPAVNGDYLAFESHTGEPWLDANAHLVDLLIVRSVKSYENYLGKAILLWQDGHFFLGKLVQEAKAWGLVDYRHAEFIPFKKKATRFFLVQYKLANAFSD